MASIKFEKVNKIYPNGVRALTDVSFEIKDGEFCVFVGPSGCGKSTMLRMIAGLEEVTTGKLYIDGVISNEVLPKDREIAMVFQNYALYPHLTVFQNMAFGLQMQAVIDKDHPTDENGKIIKTKYSREEIRERVEEAARLLDIEPLLSRKPGQLSGGQKQRVALGRALVRRPKIFLLDEPLSNVDAQIRTQMRSEIKKLQNSLKATFIYVTHDQTEAMTMADKIVVMNNGVIQQIGTPLELFFLPRNLFVATFIGTPMMNTFDAQIIKKGDELYIKPDGFEAFIAPEHLKYELANVDFEGKDLVCGIRPEHISLSKADEGELHGQLLNAEYLGSDNSYYLNVNGREFVSVSKNYQDTSSDVIGITLDRNNLHFFLKDSGSSISGLVETFYLSHASIDDNGIISFDGESGESDLLRRLFDKDGVDFNDITIGARTDCISLNEIEESLKINVSITYRKEVVNGIIYCARTSDGQNISFRGTDDKEFKVGDKVSLYIPLFELSIFDKPYGKRLTAKWELFDDVIDARGTNNASIKRKSKYARALVLDDDDLIDKTVVYAKYDNNKYVTVIVDGHFDRHNSPYIYIKLEGETDTIVSNEREESNISN